MDLEVRIDISLSEISHSELLEITENIEFLGAQPPVEIYNSFKDKKIDYSKGYRVVRVDRCLGKNLGETLLQYTIFDNASVEEMNPTIIGLRAYTLDEIDSLKRKSSLGVHSDLELK